MKRPETALAWARAAVETMMRRYAPEDLPPKGHFHYHQGVFLSGVEHTWRLCGDDRYIDYVEKWIRSVFDADGAIIDHVPGTLDDMQPGILLYPLLDRTGDPWFRRCIESVRREYANVPRTAEGGWWHKASTRDQLWLDGLYMGGPFAAEYAERFGDGELAREVVHEAVLMQEKTRDQRTGLWVHAWDGAREEDWADPKTGRSPEFWGRAMGWVPVALFDDADHFPAGSEAQKTLVGLGVQLLTALARYQSADGRWYQVVDKGTEPGNWLENSCSCLYAAGMARAVRRGWMDASYLFCARRCMDGVTRDVQLDGDDVLVGNVCIGTGVGDYEHYIHRPVSVNDLHGMGAFLLMCTELAAAE